MKKHKGLFGGISALFLFLAIGFCGADNILGTVICIAVFGLASWKGGFLNQKY